MANNRKRFTLELAALILIVGPVGVAARAENVDPNNDDSQYAYAENVGWLNAEASGDGGPGVQVGDSELSGWLYGENIGWISLSCQNTLSCGSQSYGVTNDGTGQLGGFAWAENVGWISFSCANTDACSTSEYGVSIDPSTGVWSGVAWSENIGWVSFNCSNTSSCDTAIYQVKSGWVCDPLPPEPTGVSILTADKDVDDTVLRWILDVGATGSDVTRGDLGILRNSSGNFSAATSGCLADNRTTTSALAGAMPGPGQGVWYLVRGQNCGGNGTYDSVGQIQPRDVGIAGSGSDCP